jgi:hypothetical protein
MTAVIGLHHKAHPGAPPEFRRYRQNPAAAPTAPPMMYFTLTSCEETFSIHVQGSHPILSNTQFA